MIYTFDTLRRQVLRHLDEEDDTDTSKSLASDFLNQAHQLWCADPRMKPFLLLPEFTLTVEAGRALYALPPMTDKVLYLRDPVSMRTLHEIPARSVDAESREGCRQDGYMLWGHWPVSRQPVAPSTLRIVSDNAADMSSLVIKGLDASGDLLADLVTLNGTFVVAGMVSFSQILSVTKETATLGNVTVSDMAGPLVRLQPLEFGRQYRVVELSQVPTASRVLTGRVYRKPVILINDYDVPDIPAPYTQGLIWEALLMFAGYNTDIGRTSEWSRLREEWKASLDRHLWEGDTLGARGTFIHPEGLWER